MTLSVVSDLNPGDVISDAWVDSVRVNLNEHKAFAEGSAPFPGGSQKFAGDLDFYLGKITSARPYLAVDANDYLEYNRTDNAWRFAMGSGTAFEIDANGLIQTAAFTSSEQTVTNGSTTNIAHGLGVKPRFFGALYGASSGASNCTRIAIPSFNSLGAFFRLKEVDATNMVVVNETGVTIYVYAFALR
jgi:hypothetical protein